MNVFWREKPLTEVENKLLNLCLMAHGQCTHRDNISTVILRNAAEGSMNYEKSIAAAVLSIGGVHAPLPQTMEILSMPLPHIVSMIENGMFLPGWGSSFEKSGIDPIWQPVHEHIDRYFHDRYVKIGDITDLLHARDKMIYPNAACLTAATALILEIPAAISPWLFVHGRLVEWTRIFFSIAAGVYMKQQPNQSDKEAAA
jgi:citrate synthase